MIGSDEVFQDVPPNSPDESDDIAMVTAESDDAAEPNKMIEVAEMNKETDKLNLPSPTSSQQDPIIATAYRSVVGAVRQRNEDSCLVVSTGAGGHYTLLPFGLFIVADGMGGHANGHIASKMASRVVAHHVLEKIYLPLLQEGGGVNQTPIQEVMVNAVQAANSAVYGVDPEADSGTTLTAALLLGRRLHIAHVGDSRLYLFVDGVLEPVTNDHTLVQRLQDVGQPADDATMAQIRHVVLRAVGQVEEIEVDTYMRLLPKQGKLLLCSDGLCGLVADEEIQEIMAQDITEQEIVEELVGAAMAAGGYDNITGICVDFNF